MNRLSPEKENYHLPEKLESFVKVLLFLCLSVLFLLQVLPLQAPPEVRSCERGLALKIPLERRRVDQSYVYASLLFGSFRDRHTRGSRYRHLPYLLYHP